MPKLAYNVVYADLLRQIEGEVMVPGDRLPSENELVKRYGVSRMTIRKVLRLLAEEGRLDSRLGSAWRGKTGMSRSEGVADRCRPVAVYCF